MKYIVNSKLKIRNASLGWPVFSALLLLLTAHCSLLTAQAQSTEFTYQGQLQASSTPGNGSFDFEFALFDAAGGGAQIGSTVTRSGVAVANGIFSVSLDFGSGFPGAGRFLEIRVRQAGGGGFTTLSPRQAVTSSPYAIKSLNAGIADSLSAACSGCVTAGQIGSVNGSSVTGTIPVASVPAGSGSYIQNTTTPQAASNFSITGNGTAAGTLAGNTVTGNVVVATTQYNIGADRILSNAGPTNLFAGVFAGAANITGSINSFFGWSAGRNNTTGQQNAFFGGGAGQSNDSGLRNAFFGAFAGNSNTEGDDNAFFGNNAGLSNTTGGFNAFFGRRSGDANTTGSNNTIIGDNADVGAGTLNFATALGAGAVVSASNTVVLGRPGGEDTVRVPGNLGIGTTTNPVYKLDVLHGASDGIRVKSSSGFSVVDIDAASGDAALRFQKNGATQWNIRNEPGTDNLQIFEIGGFADGGERMSIENNTGNVSIGGGNPAVKLHVQGGSEAEPNGGGYIVAGSIGSTNVVIDDNEIMARSGGATAPFFINNDGGNVLLIAGGTGNVGIGTSAPADKLDVDGDIRIGLDGTNLGCVKDDNGTVIAGTCSSDLRFKKSVTPFASVLGNLTKLQPVHFYWRADEFKDKHFGPRQSYGLIAQEVEAIFPELVSTDEQGYRVVNYSKLPLLTIKAITEQQQQIETQAKEIAGQKVMIEMLAKRLAELERKQLEKIHKP